MILGLANHDGDRTHGRDAPPEEGAGLTEEDLHRIRSVAETPRHRRTPDMLRPDEATDAEEGAADR